MLEFKLGCYTSTLLRRVQDLSNNWLPIGGYTPQSGCHWTNYKVGSWTGSLGNQLQAKDSNQVTSTSWLLSWMAGKSNPSTSQRPWALGNVLWWLTQARRRRRGSFVHLPQGRTIEVCVPNLVQSLQQRTEYAALLHGLRLAVSLDIKRLLICGDSLLVV